MFPSEHIFPFSGYVCPWGLVLLIPICGMTSNMAWFLTENIKTSQTINLYNVGNTKSTN